MSRQTIGEFLSALRKANGYTQEEIAKKLGVSNRTLSSRETVALSAVIPILCAITFTALSVGQTETTVIPAFLPIAITAVDIVVGAAVYAIKCKKYKFDFK